MSIYSDPLSQRFYSSGYSHSQSLPVTMSLPRGPAAGGTLRSFVVTTTEISIEVLDQGSKQAIVILPSLGRGANDYDVVAQILEADGFRIVRPQPRGIGRSKGPMDKLTLHDFAADVAQAMDHLQVGPAVVVGHAWGSQPARMLAVDRPDLVLGLVMAAASAGKLPLGSNEKPYGRLRDEIDGAGNMALSAEQRLDCLRKAFFAPGNDTQAWLDGWYMEAHDAQAHARIYTPIDEYFSGGGIVPIMDLEGEHDAVVVKNVFKPLLGDRVEVRTILGAGHAMAPEQPQAMAEEIAAFARRLYASM
ncbi:hydrolase [Phaeosphaeria sp. MPI-PUGE-AT-0046c]|nr:hydrolase [Phaeosphaeria sp. MPI-PUGE-AT-0046c]